MRSGECQCHVTEPLGKFVSGAFDGGGGTVWYVVPTGAV